MVLTLYTVIVCGLGVLVTVMVVVPFLAYQLIRGWRTELAVLVIVM
jgi:hypothetical protein